MYYKGDKQMTKIDPLTHAIENTKEECKGSHNGRHVLIEKMDSITGYICSCCRKEVDKICQIYNKPKSECTDFNEYYNSCEECMG